MESSGAFGPPGNSRSTLAGAVTATQCCTAGFDIRQSTNTGTKITTYRMRIAAASEIGRRRRPIRTRRRTAHTSGAST